MTAKNVILIRPTGFDFDPETSASNGFQRSEPLVDVQKKAAEEFDGLLERLRQCGIGFTVLDPKDPKAPNAVFPNNWFSTHEDGKVVLYPMLTGSRRVERDPDMERVLGSEGFTTSGTEDLSAWEHNGRILEGTGSMVLDRARKLAFACLSPRTTESALKSWCNSFGYTLIAFTATVTGHMDAEPVYHTNVMMSIGEKYATVCFDAMPFPAERQEVDEELRKAGKQVITFTVEQMNHFVGNMLELRGSKAITKGAADLGDMVNGYPYIFLSETAFNALRPEQRIALEKYAQLIPVPVSTIETIGGGSVRCMIAENFLTPKTIIGKTD
ncbi:MAG: amidinotransferase [Flavobacteriales bacterium]|nr:amidinotransferase [Flavobacteriales bacterium]MBK6945220.1 amidinotransferase [Flavobacteriales bacterium]MBK7239569.1 amidinotransferase [Flavobacteriales bacterium]MBK7296117.1 amidinotransferase [Flavobacteriales bacterium]MBK9535224.1 amidinotransferase [Flavobacteriales bacterium]